MDPLEASGHDARALFSEPRVLEAGYGSTLELAFRSVVDTLGFAPGSPELVLERVFRHCRDGLYQYLFIRTNEKRALEILTRLETEMLSDETLLAPPGPRAKLFARARVELKGAVEPRFAPDDSVWWRRSGSRRAYLNGLAKLRSSLDAREFEIAELVHTRRLRHEEIAYLLGEPVEAVESTLLEVESRAIALLGEYPGSYSGTLGGALLEAFALRGSIRPPNRKAPILKDGDVVAGRYRIERHLGAGASADVYRAADLEVPDHIVALKLFRRPAADEAAREAALREMRLIASVSHPSVVQFKDHGWHEGRAFFVMPFYRGETLRERLRRGPLSRMEAKRIFVPLAEALATMHRSGVRHQDIKPENIFLARFHEDEDGEILPVLLDLGVAAKDAENVLAGTPNYFAPEIAARFAREPDPPHITNKADVFSLALALRNALSPSAEEGVPGGAVDAFIKYRARFAPEPPEGEDLAYLAPYFERWLNLAPDARPDAEELARELAILSAPEERRARTVAMLRWLVPTVVMLVGLFGAAAFALSKEADLQRLEAERAREIAALERSRAEEARQRASRVREDLDQALEASRALEADIARLEEAYQSSRLTRQELAAKLARAEGELTLLAQQHEETTRRLNYELRRTREARDGLKAELEEAQASLSEEKASLEAERHRSSELVNELASTRGDLEEAKGRISALEQTITAVRTSLENEIREAAARERDLRDEIARRDAEIRALSAPQR
ncbi:MAG: protein kinase [Sandaracinaceae bacterium]|nr:protein kinase [Sandaracinaceae bacterium]